MVEFNSFSSGLVLGATLYRNQQGVANKFVAQVGYALTAVIAAVETVAALAFSILSVAAYPFSSKPLANSMTWLSSSAFSLVWSAGYFCLNLFVKELVADEESMREMLDERDLTEIPSGAILELP